MVTPRFGFLFGMLVMLAFWGSSKTAQAAGDIEVVQQRIIAALLPQSPDEIKSVGELATQASQSLGADGSWADIDYVTAPASTWKAVEHFNRIENMVKAYRTAGQPLFGDPVLKAHIFLAFSYWLEHDYQNPNWWWNQISVPKHTAQIMLLMKADLPADLKAKGTVVVQRSQLGMTGANLTWVASNQIMLGCVLDDAEIIRAAFNRMYEEINLDPKKRDSLRPDLSFHQHGDQLYSGGYGSSFVNDCARFTAYGWGTQFQIPDPQLQLLVRFLLDGQQWIMRGKRSDYSTIGREITRAAPEPAPSYTLSNGKQFPLPDTSMGELAALPVPRQAEVAAFAKRMSGLPDASPLTGNRSFWESDYMAHQRPTFLATVKMLSKRMQNGELVNGEGLRSQFLSYGTTFIYQSGNEYNNIFPVWDWLKVPGTTLEQKADAFDKKLISAGGKTTLVGSASDGKYGVAVQDLAQGNVSGRKAWFYFDGGFFALGAGLQCPTQQPLFTTVNQCLLQSEVLADGKTLDKGVHDLSKAQWVWQSGIGYVFPGGADVHVTNQPQSGRWTDIGTGSPDLMTKDVFTLGLDHGINANQVNYAYGVLPGCAPNEISQRAKPYEILANTAELQAVADNEAGLVEVAFWKAGVLKTRVGDEISVDQPCLLLFQKLPNGRARLTVADPERKGMSIRVTLGGAYSGEGCAVLNGKTTVGVELPGEAMGGQSAVRELEAAR